MARHASERQRGQIAEKHRLNNLMNHNPLGQFSTDAPAAGLGANDIGDR
jgi:hypothetical protein